MADKFIEELKRIFPGHGNHFSAVNIGTLFLLFKMINTASSPEEKTKYSTIFDREVENIKSTFGFDTNPEVFEADRIAQIRMDEEAKAKEETKAKEAADAAKENGHTKQIVA